MSNVIVTADLHLSASPRDAYRHDFQRQLRAIVKRERASAVVICGDLTEEKDHHGAWLVNKVVEHISRLAKLCEVIIIKGNHDYVDALWPYFGFAKRLKNVHWINAPLDGHTIPALAHLGRVLLAPHVANPLEAWEGLTLDNYNWVFTHLTFQGAHVGHGMQMRGVDPAIFGKARVISGDIHVPQKIAPNVEYVGSPYLVDFGDSYQPRVLSINIDKVKSIPVTGAQKRLVEIGSLADLKEGSVPLRYVNQGDILKVRVLVTGEQRASWPDMKDKVRRWGEERGYQIDTVQPVLLDASKRKGPKPKANAKRTDRDLVVQYAKRVGLDAATLKMGLKLLERA